VIEKRRNPHREEIVRKIALTIVASFAIFVAFELGLRIFGFKYPAMADTIIVWSLKEDRLMEMGQSLHEESTKQLWKPRAGAPVPWGEEDGEAINALGLRGPALTVEPAEGVVRIAALGDSSTFGMGVKADETYIAQLGALLADAPKPVEIINGGVIGYTLRQGIHRYEEVISPLKPRIVIAAFGAVNEHLPTLDLADREKIDKRAKVTTLDRGLSWLRDSVRILHFASFWSDLVHGVDRGEIRTELFEDRQERRRMNVAAGKARWPGTRRMSPKRFRESLLEIAQAVHKDGGRLIYLSMPRHPKKEEENPILLEYSRALTGFAEARRAPLLDVRRLVYDAIEEGATWEELFVDNYHPSPAGHALIAAALNDMIRELMANEGGAGGAAGGQQMSDAEKRARAARKRR